MVKHYFLDTEFNQRGHYVELISIGIVDQNGNEYYAQNKDCNLKRANAFVQEHVLPKLDYTSWKSIRTIRREVEEFVADSDPMFWCYHGNYDWVAVCGSIFGSMVDTPPHWPHGCFDLVQYGYHLGFDKIPILEEDLDGLHNALVDARINKRSYEWLKQQEIMQKSKSGVLLSAKKTKTTNV